MGWVMATLNLTCVIIMFKLLKISAKEMFINNDMYNLSFSIENSLIADINNKDLTNDDREHKIDLTRKYADERRKKYKDEMFKYFKFTVWNIIILLFNGFLFIFNVLHYGLVAKSIGFLIDIYIFVIGLLIGR